MGLKRWIIRRLGGMLVSDESVKRLEKDLSEAVEENVLLVSERIKLQDRIDKLEMQASRESEELHRLRSIAGLSLAVRDFLCDKSYQVAVTRLSSALIESNEESS